MRGIRGPMESVWTIEADPSMDLLDHDGRRQIEKLEERHLDKRRRSSE